jgi:hypothetical protein
VVVVTQDKYVLRRVGRYKLDAVMSICVAVFFIQFPYVIQHYNLLNCDIGFVLFTPTMSVLMCKKYNSANINPLQEKFILKV